MSAFLNSQSQWPMRLCAMTVVLGLSSILGLATPVDLSQSALLVSSEEGDLEQQVAGAQAGQVVVAAFVIDGGTTQVVITPPSDRAVDPRVLGSMSVGSDDGEPIPVIMAKGQETTAAPIDLTGYRIEVIFPDSSKISCSTVFRFAAIWPYYLGPGGSLSVSARKPASMSIAAYPTDGDVDTYVYYGSNLCSSGTAGEGLLDHASCYNSGCKTSYTYYGYFVNYYSAYSSEFVGVVSVTSAKY